MTTASLQALLSRLIDYAGLFPPAALDLANAVENYRRFRTSADAWMLGAFVLPASQAVAFQSVAQTADSPDDQPFRWPVSLLVEATDLPPDGLYVVAVEAKTNDPAVVRRLVERWPTAHVFIELDPTDEREVMWATLRELGAGAKIRTGGITAAAFPAPETVASFILRAADWRVPFKATAGLHHPIRAVYPLTYAPDSPHGLMHGFLNVFLAAAFAWHGLAPDNVERVLLEEDVSNFQFTDAGVTWHCQTLPTEAIAAARQSFCRAYGSCSFDEPRTDLRALGLLD
ncbi:hypothetical protein [Chloracidobacterium thermophilum]|uniref:hypothetical protein n=1 Tax=Chloracidobacterium thermophilum TaxID=458033 RepID=UPI0007385D3B|nr:hypothetical protein [Chloracidobacterium thermophilum]